MSSVSCVSCSIPAPSVQSCQASTGPASDGDTVAQEAAESTATKQAEKSNGGYAPNSAGLVNKTA